MNQIEQINKTLALVKKAREGEFLNGDGHGIVPSEEYEKCGIDVKDLEQEFKSDFSAPTSTIFKDGKPVKSMTGVWSLDLSLIHI